VFQTTHTMDRQAILDKIQAIMALSESTTFEGEADAASTMIDRLCKRYGVTVEQAMTPQVMDEVITKGRIRSYTKVIWSAVSRFYDAQLYYKGDEVCLMGTEAQQIQARLYSEFILDCMAKEAKKAYEGEKLLAELMGNDMPRRSFLEAFKITFADKVAERLAILKQEQNRIHEHKEVTAMAVSQRRWGLVRSYHRTAGGSGAMAGACAGSSVSLNRQATGRTVKALGAA